MKRQQTYCRVRRLRLSSKDGKLKIGSTDLKRPKGIAFSPDEKYLYISNDDPEKKIIMGHEATDDRSLIDGEVFFGHDQHAGKRRLDGIKVDR